MIGNLIAKLLVWVGVALNLRERLFCILQSGCGHSGRVLADVCEGEESMPVSWCGRCGAVKRGEGGWALPFDCEMGPSDWPGGAKILKRPFKTLRQRLGSFSKSAWGFRRWGFKRGQFSLSFGFGPVRLGWERGDIGGWLADRPLLKLSKWGIRQKPFPVRCRKAQFGRLYVILYTRALPGRAAHAA